MCSVSSMQKKKEVIMKIRAMMLILLVVGRGKMDLIIK